MSLLPKPIQIDITCASFITSLVSVGTDTSLLSIVQSRKEAVTGSTLPNAIGVPYRAVLSISASLVRREEGSQRTPSLVGSKYTFITGPPPI